ncbi:undecaprenyldiphospho-muramoylpentapeptide beta-N-acetylglucosaminyltransferase [candidate division KSB1 bacterium]|nr:undecaprenyldiphospho-muramoylpentapeptide beta-N-acetylglucosaminyltransferase [candidate division KSB1 bacterium]
MNVKWVGGPCNPDSNGRHFHNQHPECEPMHQNNQSRTYLFAGGGTGGHLFPALAIAQRIKEKDPRSRIVFVGTRKGLENRIVPEFGFPLYRLTVRGFDRSRPLVNLWILLRLFWSLLQALVLVIRIRPAVVIGTGGYVSGPVLFIANVLKKKTMVQEQNSYPGITTKWLAKYVDQVHIAFLDAKEYLPDAKNIHHSGNPVRELATCSSGEKARRHFNLRPDALTLFVFGGSQGARIINETVLQALPDLMQETDIQILWSTGQTSYHTVRQSVRNFSDRIQIMGFIKEMGIAYQAADFVLCRAGALTLAELTNQGLASILIPLKTAAENHQEANAKSLVKLNAAVMIREDDLDKQRLIAEIKRLAMDPHLRIAMGQAARASSFPNATETLANAVMTLAHFSRK